MRKLLYILIFLTANYNTFAQNEIKISEKITTINNQKFFVHTIESGQTLYSISKAYKVSQTDVINANKLISPSINDGQTLYIPIYNQNNNSNGYKIHTVGKGETLFSLSKTYNITIDDIIKINPDAKYGIKIDQNLKIPVQENETITNQSKFTSYEVKHGDTLFSISQKFGISIDEIIKLNPQLKDGLKIGQIINLPKSNSEKINDSIPEKEIKDNLYFEQDGVIPCNKFNYDKTKAFNIVLLLPLHTEFNLNTINRYKEEKDPMFYKNTQRFYEFYEGILLALQKLKTQGFSANLKVFDTENDSKTVKEIMENLDYPNIDLIIGPVYSDNVKIASHYAKLNKVNLISPLSQNIELIENNPFVFQVIPSNEIRIKNVSQIINHSKYSEIIFIHNNSETEISTINFFKNELLKIDSSVLNKNDRKIKIINFEKSSAQKIKESLSSDTTNLIIIPSEEEVFVTKLTSILYSLSSEYKIEIIGTPKWEFFQSINIDYLKKMSFKYISPIFNDYSNPKTIDFLSEYKITYETEPSTFSFEGYDIMIYFGNLLKSYGRHFQFCFLKNSNLYNKNETIFDMNFKRINSEGGFENNVTSILEYNEKFILKKTEF